MSTLNEEIKKSIRKVLGPTWCANGCGVRDRMPHPVCDCRGDCRRVIEPSPAVAYALAEKLNATCIASYRLAGGPWRAEAALGDGDEDSVEMEGPTRCEAECRALVILAGRKEVA